MDNNPSAKLFIEVSEADIRTLRDYAVFLNRERRVFFNWRTAFSHLLAEARIEMNSAVFPVPVPSELPFADL